MWERGWKESRGLVRVFIFIFYFIFRGHRDQGEAVYFYGWFEKALIEKGLSLFRSLSQEIIKAFIRIFLDEIDHSLC